MFDFVTKSNKFLSDEWNRTDLVAGSELVSIDVHGKAGFGGKVVVQMAFLHQKGGFHGEIVDRAGFVHEKGTFHGEVMGKVRFLHQKSEFGGEKWLGAWEQHKAGIASPLAQLAQPALNIRPAYLPDVVL